MEHRGVSPGLRVEIKETVLMRMDLSCILKTK